MRYEENDLIFYLGRRLFQIKFLDVVAAEI